MTNRAFARANPDEVSARLKHLLSHAEAIARMCSGETEENLDIAPGKTGISVKHLHNHLNHIEKECIAVAHILEEGIKQPTDDPLEALATEKTPAPQSILQLTLDQLESTFMFHAMSFALCTLLEDIAGGLFCTIQLQRTVQKLGKDRMHLFTDRFFRLLQKTWPEQVQVANPTEDAGVEEVMKMLGFEKVSSDPDFELGPEVSDDDDEDDS